MPYLSHAGMFPFLAVVTFLYTLPYVLGRIFTYALITNHAHKDVHPCAVYVQREYTQ